MTAASLIRRLLLCGLALCVAGTGLSAVTLRAAEVEAEVKAEEVAVRETTRRQNVERSGQAAPAARTPIRPRIARVVSRAAGLEAAPSSLRAMNVRIQV